MLFLVEAVPTLVWSVVIAFWMADWPREARWLTEAEREVAATTAAGPTAWGMP